MGLERANNSMASNLRQTEVHLAKQLNNDVLINRDVFFLFI